jgi:hypothetical protein
MANPHTTESLSAVLTLLFDGVPSETRYSAIRRVLDQRNQLELAVSIAVRMPEDALDSLRAAVEREQHLRGNERRIRSQMKFWEKVQK